MCGSRNSKGVSDRGSTTIRSSTGFFSLGWTARCGHFCCTEGNSSSNSSCTSSGAARLTLSGRHALPGTNCPPGLLSAVLAAAAAAAGANAVRQHLQQLLSSPPVAVTRGRYRFLTASVSVSAKRGGLMSVTLLRTQFCCLVSLLLLHLLLLLLLLSLLVLLAMVSAAAAHAACWQRHWKHRKQRLYRLRQQQQDTSASCLLLVLVLQ